MWGVGGSFLCMRKPVWFFFFMTTPTWPCQQLNYTKVVKKCVASSRNGNIVVASQEWHFRINFKPCSLYRTWSGNFTLLICVQHYVYLYNKHMYVFERGVRLNPRTPCRWLRACLICHEFLQLFITLFILKCKALL